MVSAAEARRKRIAIKRQLKLSARGICDPYTAAFQKYHERAVSPEPPKPHRLHDKYWAKTPRQQILTNERIRWRDIDIIQQYLAPNGYILPRRTTLLTRRNQRDLIKAVRIAQQMALLPYNWRPFDYQAMPLMDPLQFMADRLLEKWRDMQDARARAMLVVMVKKYPYLNYREYFRYCREKGVSAGSMGTVENENEDVPPKKQGELISQIS
eukprot:GEMP01054363.1.p1 GENE.GEMP01054363.1~~GEMP01054363.1.p1  ORF type:complete len:211 (+),score=25.97 GEMP01054363.1:449-1081(+)